MRRGRLGGCDQIQGMCLKLRRSKVNVGVCRAREVPNLINSYPETTHPIGLGCNSCSCVKDRPASCVKGLPRFAWWLWRTGCEGVDLTGASALPRTRVDTSREEATVEAAQLGGVRCCLPASCIQCQGQPCIQCQEPSCVQCPGLQEAQVWGQRHMWHFRRETPTQERGQAQTTPEGPG